MTPRGRPSDGSDMVDKLDVEDPDQRERLRAVLSTLTGEMTMEEAAASIGIGAEQLRRLRWRGLHGMADAVGISRPGPAPADDRVVYGDPAELSARLEAQDREIRRLKVELEAQRVREEIEMTMPHVLDEDRRSKKNASRQQAQAKAKAKARKARKANRANKHRR